MSCHIMMPINWTKNQYWIEIGFLGSIDDVVVSIKTPSAWGFLMCYVQRDRLFVTISRAQIQPFLSSIFEIYTQLVVLAIKAGV